MSRAQGSEPIQRAQRLLEQTHFVIVRFSSLGDVVKATGLPRLIKARYPAARVTMVTSEAYLDLIRDNPHLERAIGFDRAGGLRSLLALARWLRSQRPVLLVDVHRSLRSRLLRALSLGLPRTAYTKRTLQRALLVRFGLDTYREPRGKERDFLAGLEPYGIRDDGLGTELYLERVRTDPGLHVRLGRELQTLRQWRHQGRPVLGVAPVAAWELKRWPMAHFRRLMESYLGATGGGLVVFGGSADHDAHALVDGLGEQALSLVGRTSLLESAYFASLLDVLLANDTGMTHLAEAVGTPVVALYGPTSRHLGYYPLRAQSLALERQLSCRPCSRMGEGWCRHPLHKACLVGIGPEEALHQVLVRLPSPQAGSILPAAVTRS